MREEPETEQSDPPEDQLEEEDEADAEEAVQWAPAQGGYGAWQLREPLGRWAGAPAAAGPAEGVAYAEFGLRAVAFAIDQAILYLMMRWFADVLNGRLALVTPEPDGSVDPVLLLLVGLTATAAMLLTSAGIAVYGWRVLRASPGQLALGLSTLRHSDGAQIGTTTAFIRWILLFAPAIFMTGTPRAVVGSIVWPYPSWLYDFFGLAPLLVLVWYLLLGVTTLNDPRGRGLLDRLAGTVVVREID
jgi:uncharacterized RDD family membrane protein YckC